MSTSLSPSDGADRLWSIAWRVCRRELRGGLSGFRIFLACLALGVGSIAAVGNVSESVLSALERDGRKLLGGDVELRLTHQEATGDQIEWLRANTERVAELATMRTTAYGPDQRRLVELKAVDDAYPLFGEMELADGVAFDGILEKKDGVWGAVTEAGLLERLRIEVGDTVALGDIDVQIRGVIATEPDKAVGFFNFGPRLMVSMDGLMETGLVQPGSLIRYYYALDINDNETPTAFRERLEERFEEAGWRIRDTANANPGLKRFIERLTLFLTLVGLSALLVGGIGVANAVRSHIESKTSVIATLKSIGASHALVLRIYFLQILVLALIGIAIGLLIGAVTPALIAPALAGRLPIDVTLGPALPSLIIATSFGVLTTLVFALPSLLRAREIPAARLFRASAGLFSGSPVRKRDLPYIGVPLVLLLILTVLTATDKAIALGFIGGSAAAVVIFTFAGRGIVSLSKRLITGRSAFSRLALANLHRPGASTVPVALSLGLGLTLLVTISGIEGNLDNEINENLPDSAPAFFFLDIRPDQIDQFRDQLLAQDNVSDIEQTPMLRGRVTAVDGVNSNDVGPGDDRWFLRGDRGLTFAATAPPETKLVRGEWWPADYNDASKPLVSISADIGRAFDLEPGDTLTINVLGRDITAEIANWREIEWQSLRMNFAMVFSPGLIDKAPYSLIATAHMPREMEEPVDRMIGMDFPNVSAIRVREALEAANAILAGIGTALNATSMIAIVAGVLVLGGAVAAGRRKRIYDAVVLKTLGATRSNILYAYALEYGILGLATGVIAAFVGSVAAWSVLVLIMEANWVLLPMTIIGPIAIGLFATLAAGFVGTWQALRSPAAPLLRNE
ncbi:FtsX-like permease family protein [Thalassospira sp.]|uniref:ABC transporter permease n=1 Tax=Thalassospira sp. TaxID=1912094 RepID=UPI001B201507|nr:FtsX-like permease family protein [Thalassospira sp.]MBO6806358.1 FtsX-like permease family protein [Thalassospira sp.]MBO6839120.1 FtsX-like permease family protein [Thalassospira sp.]